MTYLAVRVLESMPAFDPSCIDVEDFLECLEIRNIDRATEKEFCFSCPYPAHVKGDESPSAYMNVATTAFFCHSCHAKGNAISFTTDVLGISPITAIRFLKQRYAPGGLDPDARCMVEEIRKILYKKKPEKRQNKILDESVLDAYYMDWATIARFKAPHATYMLDRGFSIQTLTEWQFGYSAEYERITLPIREEHGLLVGIKARAMDSRRPKYLNLRDDTNNVEPYLKNEVVFALDRARAWDDYDGILIVVEGEFNAIAMHSLGYENTVAINGSYFGNRQIRLIKEYAERVILFFDSDRAGFDATRALAEALLPFVFVDVCPDHFGDPVEMHPYSVKRCLAEARGFIEVQLAIA
jgi:DNA primase